MIPIRINLLPHRQEKRARQQRMFAVMSVASAALGLMIVAAGQMYLTNAQSAQERRNQFLRSEIANLDRQIAEIAQLREKTENLLSRKDVVESLQSDRSISVHLLDELARRLPDGLYLKSVQQTGDSLALNGYAQSSARVSTFMRALEEAPLFQNPVLIEVKAAQVNNLRINEFSLTVTLERPAEKAEQGKGGKT